MSDTYGVDAHSEAELHFHRDAPLVVGARGWIEHGVVMHIATGITIGDDVLISWDCLLMDTDMHSLEWQGRHRDAEIARLGKGKSKDWSTVRCLPIVIEDKVWIGARCIVLPGAHIGEGAVIGAGSVVRGRIPPYTVYAGNPAVMLKRLVKA